MSDDPHQREFQTSSSNSSEMGPRIDPRSCYGPPAQDYINFCLSSSQLSLGENAFEIVTRQLPEQSLQPSEILQWPWTPNSQVPRLICSRNVQPVSSTPMVLPTTSTTRLPYRSGTSHHKKLTNSDRKEICDYAKRYESLTQTEIGLHFGVDRSTVSKILSSKKNHLFQGCGSRLRARRSKARLLTVERTLAVWAKKQIEKGFAPSDKCILEKLHTFSAASESPGVRLDFDTSWLREFKIKNNLPHAKMRKSSPVDDIHNTWPDDVSPSYRQISRPPLLEEICNARSAENIITSTITTPSFSSALPSTADSDTWASSPRIEYEGYLLRSKANTNPGADSSQQKEPEVMFDGISTPELLTTKYLPCAAFVYAAPEHTGSLLEDVLASSHSHGVAQPKIMVSGSLGAVPTVPITSREEALQAMNIVLDFLERQPHGYLDAVESLNVGKIVKKLELETQPT